MRYIGCKERIIKNIDDLIRTKCSDSYGGIFCDLFAGTGTVGSFFKDRFRIIANDYLFFSYAINAAFILNNDIPKFSKIKKVLNIADVFDYLESAIIPTDVSNNFFITKNYSDYDFNERLYITKDNARRIDFIRSTIDEWKKHNLISISEYLYLIGCLVYSVPSYSNVTGTYGAFLKYWDKRCLKKYELQRINPLNNNMKNEVYNADSNELIYKINGDVLYIDPPYNSRDYLSNYHLLETIAKNDSPAISGVTGTRKTSKEKSSYCSVKKVLASMDNLVLNANFRHIIISYNSEGLLTKDQIMEILTKYCVSSTVECREVEFKRYQSKKTDSSRTVVEYLFYGMKDIPVSNTLSIKSKDKKNATATKYVKSPTNYIGGKWRLLNQLIPLFPKRVESFVDLFAGGFNIAANVNANVYYVNDINYKVLDMFKTLIETPIGDILFHIESQIKEFKLTKTDQEAYNRFRDFYNKKQNSIDLFLLSCFSFNYQFRFNSKGEYNNPFGKNRSWYSSETEKKLIVFKQRMADKRLVYSSLDFREFDISKLKKDSFIYCDPPYLLTTGSYNDGKRCFGDWLEKDEKDLLTFLDKANELGIKFALSEITKKGNKENKMLIEWSNKYNVYIINSDYSNCNYQVKEKDSLSEEVLVTNYVV